LKGGSGKTPMCNCGGGVLRKGGGSVFIQRKLHKTKKPTSAPRYPASRRPRRSDVIQQVKVKGRTKTVSDLSLWLCESIKGGRLQLHYKRKNRDFATHRKKKKTKPKESGSHRGGGEGTRRRARETGVLGKLPAGGPVPCVYPQEMKVERSISYIKQESGPLTKGLEHPGGRHTLQENLPIGLKLPMRKGELTPPLAPSEETVKNRRRNSRKHTLSLRAVSNTFLRRAKKSETCQKSQKEGGIQNSKITASNNKEKRPERVNPIAPFLGKNGGETPCSGSVLQ